MSVTRANRVVLDEYLAALDREEQARIAFVAAQRLLAEAVVARAGAWDALEAAAAVVPPPQEASSTVTGPVVVPMAAAGQGAVGSARRVIVRVRRGADRMFVKQLSEHSRTFTPNPALATTFEVADRAALDRLLEDLREAKCFEPELLDAGALQ